MTLINRAPNSHQRGDKTPKTQIALSHRGSLCWRVFGYQCW